MEAGFAVIDINFGCPVKKVLGRCRGGFHLSQPETALEIVRRTRDIVPSEIPVTVKMRRGLDDSPESRDNFFQIFEGRFCGGHRSGNGAWSNCGAALQRPKSLGVSQGPEARVSATHRTGQRDLFTPQDCLRMIAETGVDGVTVARGAIGNPWIFRSAAHLPRATYACRAHGARTAAGAPETHWELGESLYGPARCGPLLRKFGIKYAASHPQHLEVRPRFYACSHA